MKKANKDLSNPLFLGADCPAVNVPSFLMKRVSVASPKPSRQYHYHDCYEFYYLHSGDRYYFINDKTYHVPEGSAVFIEPYTIHSSFNFERSGYDRTVIYFRKDFIESILKGANSNAFEDNLAGSHIRVLNIKSRTLTEAVIDAMQTAYQKGNTAQPYLKIALAQLIMMLADSESQRELPSIEYANATHKMICEITGYINNNFRDNITLDGISKRFFISPCYFSRTFKSMTGLSFTEYINNVRIKESLTLLESTDTSILQISEAVGFAGNTHFGRVFKRIVGMSPMQYRKNFSKR